MNNENSGAFVVVWSTNRELGGTNFYLKDDYKAFRFSNLEEKGQALEDAEALYKEVQLLPATYSAHLTVTLQSTDY
jgi:hypothetical protein